MGFRAQIPLLAAVVMLAFIALTNRHLGFHEGIDYLHATDSANYERIAAAAPAFPSGSMVFHHAQRFPAHWLIGMAARATGTGVGSLYWGAVVALLLAIVGVMSRALAPLKLSLASQTLCYAVFFANPYVERYYLLVPTILTDLLFILGLAVILDGLMGVRAWKVLAGMALATLGKQNAASLLPGVAYWLWKVPAWRGRSGTNRAAAVMGAFAISIGIFVLTAWAISGFADPPMKTGLMLSLPQWILHSFDAGLLAEHIARTLLPFVLTGGLWLALKPSRLSPQQAGALLMAAGVAAFPLIHSPVLAQKTEGRYSSLAGLALILGFAFELARREKAGLRLRLSRPAGVCLLGAIAASSIHHMYSAFGPETAFGFMLLHLAACGVAALSLSGVSRG